MNIYAIRLSSFFSALAIMFLWESLRPKRKWEIARWKRWAFHGAVSAVNTLLTRLCLILPLVWWIHFVRDHGWGAASWLGLAGFWEIALTVIVFDMFDYWWHRFNHRIPFLWRFHKFHHYDTHVDTTTALRFQPGELFLSYGVKAVWILIWGPSLIAFFVFETLITAYSIFHHSNIDVSDPVERILRLVHMTPRLHASHHTVTLRTRNANYATIFLVWDRLFGSLRQPDFDEMKSLGIDEGRQSYLTWGAYLKAPFRKME